MSASEHYILFIYIIIIIIVIIIFLYPRKNEGVKKF